MLIERSKRSFSELLKQFLHAFSLIFAGSNACLMIMVLSQSKLVNSLPFLSKPMQRTKPNRLKRRRLTPKEYAMYGDEGPPSDSCDGGDERVFDTTRLIDMSVVASD